MCKAEDDTFASDEDVLRISKRLIRQNKDAHFYLSCENCQTVSVKLSWSYYCELLSVAVKDKRSFYEKEAINPNLTNPEPA